MQRPNTVSEQSQHRARPITWNVCSIQCGSATTDRQKFSADPEFSKPFLRSFLAGHHIMLEERLSRSSHKNGLIERSNGVFKNVLSCIWRKITQNSLARLVTRASFLANVLKGSSILEFVPTSSWIYTFRCRNVHRIRASSTHRHSYRIIRSSSRP